MGARSCHLEPQIRAGRRGHGVGRGIGENGVAVRLGLRDRGHADGVAGAGTIFDDDRLSDLRRDLIHHHARHHVGGTAGGQGDDQADRLGRPSLRGRLRPRGGPGTGQAGKRDGRRKPPARRSRSHHVGFSYVRFLGCGLLGTRMALEGSPAARYTMAAPCRHATSCAGPTSGSSRNQNGSFRDQICRVPRVFGVI